MIFRLCSYFIDLSIIVNYLMISVFLAFQIIHFHVNDQNYFLSYFFITLKVAYLVQFEND